MNCAVGRGAWVSVRAFVENAMLCEDVFLYQGRCACGISAVQDETPVHAQLWWACVNRHREIASWREPPFLGFPWCILSAMEGL